jgi:hypothetical protein
MLRVGDRELQLEVLCTSHMLIQGASGSGKSYLLRVLAEQLCGTIQTIIIDPEGEYNTLREKFPFVLVGEGGETPASVKTADLLAKRLVEIGASAICDLYALEREDQQEWIRLFITSLMSLPRSQWKPLVVIIDEAHLFVPEKGEGSAISTRAVEDFCSRGRKHGIGIILATQRITKVSNNAAGNLQNYFIGRTFIQTDRERAAKVMGVPNRQAEKEAFFSDLKVLKPGQFWALGVAVTVDKALVTVQSAQTTHPKAGALTTHKPPAPDKIRAMLPQLADLPKEAATEEAEIEQLRREANKLRTEAYNHAQETGRAMELNRELREMLENQKPVVMLPNVNGIRERIEKFDADVAFENKLEEICRELRGSFRALFEGIETDLQAVTEVPQAPARIAPPTVFGGPTVSRNTATGALPVPPVVKDGELSKPQMEYLLRLAQFHELGRSHVSLTWLASTMSTTVRARGFEENIRTLRSKGYITTQGGDVRLNDVSKVGKSAPLTRPQILDRIRQFLSGPQWQYLSVLIESSPKGWTVERLASAFNTTVRARGFEENIRFLRSNELIAKEGDTVRAAEWLFV